MPKGAADSMERLCLAAGVLKPWMCRLFARRWYQRFTAGFVNRFWPGELMRLTLRKRFVDDEVRVAIDEGARQVLIVGAGFDTLGLRIAEEFPSVAVVEVDMPATAERRRTAIEKMGSARSNHTVVGADLSKKSMGDVIRAVPGWKADATTVTVAEGVVMYLDEDQVTAFLGQIKDSTGPGSRLVLSYLLADSKGRPQLGRFSGLTRASLKFVGEPLKWCVYEQELPEFLGAAGFHLVSPGDRYDLRRRYLVPIGIAQPVGDMERFAVAASAQLAA
jgi:methyltransferase (TIGR00027 family)